MFRLFERAAHSAVDVATLPASIAADVVTMGGAIDDREEPYTATKVKRLTSDAWDGMKALAE